jgi:hypothetical protein
MMIMACHDNFNHNASVFDNCSDIVIIIMSLTDICGDNPGDYKKTNSVAFSPQANYTD